VLGVASDASPEEIRTAYRRLAREHHPDVAGAGANDTIRSLNAAYAVLADPVRRYAYDRQLRAAPDAAPAGEPVTVPVPDDPPPPLPATRFPWRGLTLATTVAVVAVATASVLTGPPEPEQPDGILEPGSCVTIEPNTDAREVACTGAADLVVREVVPIGSGCPFETEGHRDHQGQGTACVAAATPTSAG
jgi:molecular chaperone DnaJ